MSSIDFTDMATWIYFLCFNVSVFHIITESLTLNLIFRHKLQNYILEGGFPRTILLENMSAKRRYVQSVINEIFEKDNRRRLKIRNKSTFETVQKYIINNFGATTSLKSLKKAIAQTGTPISEATIARYIKALVDAKILYECPRSQGKY